MTVSEQIVQVIDSLAEKVGIAIDWSGQNIMPYLQDLIRRIAYMKITENIILLLLSALCVFIVFKSVKTLKKFDDDSDEVDVMIGTLLIFVIIGLGVAALILGIMGIVGLPSSIFLPEVTAYKYLLEAIKW